VKGPRPFGVRMGLPLPAHSEPNGVDNLGWRYMRLLNPPDPFCHVAACYTEEAGVYCVKAYVDVDYDNAPAQTAMAHILTAQLQSAYGKARYFEPIPPHWPFLPSPTTTRVWKVAADDIDEVGLVITHGEFKLQYMFDNYEQVRESLPQGQLVIEQRRGGFLPAR